MSLLSCEMTALKDIFCIYWWYCKHPIRETFNDCVPDGKRSVDSSYRFTYSSIAVCLIFLLRRYFVSFFSISCKNLRTFDFSEASSFHVQGCLQVGGPWIHVNQHLINRWGGLSGSRQLWGCTVLTLICAFVGGRPSDCKVCFPTSWLTSHQLSGGKERNQSRDRGRGWDGERDSDDGRDTERGHRAELCNYVFLSLDRPAEMSV